jgi:energy-coupling factor transporter transmembrane protein EcfT
LPRAEAYLQGQLKDNETVLWAGTTNIRRRMNRLWWVSPAVLALILACVFMVVVNPHLGWIHLLISLAVVLGATAYVVKIQRDYLSRNLYAVTSRRALIMHIGEPSRTQAYPPHKLSFLEVKDRGNGYGDVLFTRLRATSASSNMRNTSVLYGFEDIANPEAVADLIRQTLL